jgi:hypothetical protein
MLTRTAATKRARRRKYYFFVSLASRDSRMSGYSRGLRAMCIATSFIAACSHLKLRPRPLNILYALVRGVRTLGHKRQRATGEPAPLPSVAADPVVTPADSARVCELSATSPFCCRVTFGSHIFRHVCPWHRAVPARFIANDRYLVKLFEPGGRPFLPFLFLFVSNS